MKKWELARYLIDAKKCVDSIMFIKNNQSKLNINFREKITGKRDKFYINSCVILDECFKNKKKLCTEDKIAKALYYERDKNTAHKDSNYIPKKYSSVGELEKDLKKQIRHVKKICKDKLPDVITLDFVPYDFELFRLIKGLNKRNENELKESRYELYSEMTSKNISESVEYVKSQSSQLKEEYSVISDTEDIRLMSDEDKRNGVVVFQGGLNDYEDIQMRQDQVIILNALHDTDIWPRFNKEVKRKIDEMRKSGLFDEFNRPQEITVLHNPDFIKNILLKDIEATVKNQK
ncbi:hypothetical protein RAK27_00350 [Carnobacterium maltaromaticum]|uniref:DUF4435 domain-containing protein n=1 Tax=Carnobacterium maltaromaticum TaxID=2751 RepID=A0AAW9JL40_CARML|nr:hypothetical protein [Carnobacterium maltaromaticum]MDZ5757102.1 hypothetical protein [Carnobacterium maltaromaticum]